MTQLDKIMSIFINNLFQTISKALKQRIKDPRMIPKGLKKREQKLTKMMSLIFGCFLVTYLPSMVVLTVQHVKRPRALMSEVLQKTSKLVA